MHDYIEGKRCSFSPFVRVAIKNLSSKNFYSEEACKKALAEEVTRLLKEFRVAPYPFEGLVSTEEHKALRLAIAEDRVGYAVDVRPTCYCKTVYNGSFCLCPTMDEAELEGKRRTKACYLCGAIDSCHIEAKEIEK